MRTILALVLVSGMAAFAQENAPVKPTEKEWPLYSISWSHDYERTAWVKVIRHEEFGLERVQIMGFSVRLRTDSRDYTSIIFIGKLDSSLEPSYAEAVILVPVAEDVDVWQSEINRWKRMREKYLDQFKPRRVLPASPNR